MAPVKLYSKPACGQCDMTKRMFDREGVNYEEIDMTLDPEALNLVKGLGFFQAPVIIAEHANLSWSGFRPDMIKEMLNTNPVSAVAANG